MCHTRADSGLTIACSSVYFCMSAGPYEPDILKTTCWIFFKLTALMHFWEIMNASDIGLKRPKIKVTMHYKCRKKNFGQIHSTVSRKLMNIA